MEVWDFISKKQMADIPVILLYVVQSEGSSPGRQGFKMGVAADGSFQGTIGGGIMEHKFVEMAKDHLKQSKHGHALYRQIHDKTSGKNQSGMICSGEQTILFYKIQEKDIIAIHAITEAIIHNKNGTLQLTPQGINFSGEVLNADFTFEQQENDFSFKEKTGFKNILHIIGGGHCALALSRLVSTLDFYIHVYDDRSGLNTFDQNNFAHNKVNVASYSELSSLITGGENIYVVIMTFGYRTDDSAVRALLDKKFKYMGILGSKKKIDKMFIEYRKENIPPDRLREIHAPVGISIKSETTAEIAVSIAAEIISVKNNY